MSIIDWLIAIAAFLFIFLFLLALFTPEIKYDYETFLEGRTEEEKKWDEENGY